MGVDEAIAESPIDRFALPAAEIAKQTPAKPAAIAANIASASRTPTPPKAGIRLASEIAAACNSIAELETAIRAFDGCSLKFTATNTVIADGAANSRIMIIGEAPGADEDRQGIPFCGASGQLLNKMLAAIGLNRSKNCYITNMIYWRPPGNRNPSTEEISICQPFVRRHVELFNPAIVICAGGTATSALLESTLGITRLRGKWHNLTIGEKTFPCFAIYHPAYLMRQPAHKRYSWHDLLQIKTRAKELNLL